MLIVIEVKIEYGLKPLQKKLHLLNCNYWPILNWREPIMGRKDFRQREAKKPKKDAKKSSPIIFEPQAEVEVIKKGKKPRPEGEEE